MNPEDRAENYTMYVVSSVNSEIRLAVFMFFMETKGAVCYTIMIKKHDDENRKMD